MDRLTLFRPPLVSCEEALFQAARALSVPRCPLRDDDRTQHGRQRPDETPTGQPLSTPLLPLSVTDRIPDPIRTASSTSGESVGRSGASSLAGVTTLGSRAGREAFGARAGPIRAGAVVGHAGRRACRRRLRVAIRFPGCPRKSNGRASCRLDAARRDCCLPPPATLCPLEVTGAHPGGLSRLADHEARDAFSAKGSVRS
ncbi:hypothetical protein HPB47_000673 [Ixodes persulcatus]|uniref:Uncharacterized protein n=1 Tax=Ixodes persulcatus TaxID=34615 RepID=A0AC60PR31_IXOPE|nr:hypothetical protein HPB47_000673 [Ixodes persulcatus]